MFHHMGACEDCGSFADFVSIASCHSGASRATTHYYCPGYMGIFVSIYPKPYYIYLMGSMHRKPQTLNPIFYLLEGDYRLRPRVKGRPWLVIRR